MWRVAFNHHPPQHHPNIIPSPTIIKLLCVKLEYYSRHFSSSIIPLKRPWFSAVFFPQDQLHFEVDLVWDIFRHPEEVLVKLAEKCGVCQIRMGCPKIGREGRHQGPFFPVFCDVFVIIYVFVLIAQNFLVLIIPVLFFGYVIYFVSVALLLVVYFIWFWKVHIE